MAEGAWRAWVPAASGERFVLGRRLPDLPGLWDLVERPDAAVYWAGVLRENLDYLVRLVESEGDASESCAAREVAWILLGLFGDLERGEAARHLRTVHRVTCVREAVWRGHGVADPCRWLKAREAERWLGEASVRARRAWDLGAPEVDEASRIEGVAGLLADALAGNLFDLGSRATQEAFRRGLLDATAGARFEPAARHFVGRLAAGARERLLGLGAGGRVLIFADNAGPDFLLGLVPLALFLSRRCEVRIAANAEPASNDVTCAEAEVLLDRLACGVAPLARLLAEGRLGVVSTGTGSPGIDLRHVGAELNRVAESCDWVVIDGQGRGVETNWRTEFTCPVLRLAVIKDPWVAEAVGAAPEAPLLRWDE